MLLQNNCYTFSTNYLNLAYRLFSGVIKLYSFSYDEASELCSIFFFFMNKNEDISYNDTPPPHDKFIQTALFQNEFSL